MKAKEQKRKKKEKNFDVFMIEVAGHFRQHTMLRRSCFNHTCIDLIDRFDGDKQLMKYQQKMLTKKGQIKAREVLKYVRKKHPVKGRGDDNTAFFYAEYAARMCPRLRGRFMPIVFDYVTFII